MSQEIFDNDEIAMRRGRRKSTEDQQLVPSEYADTTFPIGTLITVTPKDQEKIVQEELVAVDKLYASKANELHTSVDKDGIEIGMGVMVIPKRTIQLTMKLPTDLEEVEGGIDNIIDLIRPYLGTYGARVVHILYEIANDPPYWRNPSITIDSNELLDRLGEKRDSRGIHYTRNRERLRNALIAATTLEIYAEYKIWEKGQLVRKAKRQSVLTWTGGSFLADEHGGLTTEQLFQHGLPKSVDVRLNFYDGVRRPDGRLGNQYVLMPRLGDPKKLQSARHASTEELIKSYLLFRYRQTRMSSRNLSVTRQTAMEKANITNKNITRATQTLERALNRLVADGTLVSFTSIPLRPHETFECVLSEQAVFIPTQ